MGRLFWKFFFFFWLAQVLTSVGVGVAIWLQHPEHEHEPRVFDRRQAAPGSSGPGHRPPPPHEGGRKPHGPPGPMLPIIAGSIVSIIFAALLAWYFARPIRSLRRAFEAVAGGALETRIGASMGKRRDELADLGQNFDHMAERLQGLVEGQRRLLHDVSHEMRSPLARLQAATDLIRQQPERSAEFVARIERDTARMDRLVGELLTLARLDAGITGKHGDAVDLREVIAGIVDDARFEAERKGCIVAVEIDDAAVVHGSHELLHRALENVVRNAVRFSPEGASVAVSAELTDGRQRITVADRGPGVPAAELETIFEPFFRSGTHGSAGYGLGLAISRRIVEAHGGRISAANRDGGGLRVTLELPIKAP